MKRDIDLAKEALFGHSIAIVRDRTLITRDTRGISPMLDLIAEGAALEGASVADRIVGRAAAMLFTLAGIRTVHACVISRPALAYLLSHGIFCRYECLTEHIINRRGDDICPMEAAVLTVEDPHEALPLLRKRREELRSGTSSAQSAQRMP